MGDDGGGGIDGPDGVASSRTVGAPASVIFPTPHKMVKCGPAGMRACSLGLVVGLGFRVRDKVSVKDRVGARISTFYFLSH